MILKEWVKTAIVGTSLVGVFYTFVFLFSIMIAG